MNNFKLAEKRLCTICNLPLSDNEHGNRKSHLYCAYSSKKQRQKEKYRIGNAAKLKIQKNEAVAASLYKLDQNKQGIPYLVAMGQGLIFDCPSFKHKWQNKDVYMFDKYGYAIETKNHETLIFIYYESDLKLLF